jgi:DNA-binding NtrC family response regulator
MCHKQVLIIEDDEKLIRLYSKVISQRHTVAQATSLDTARELLHSRDFDVIICDMQMGMHRTTELIKEEYAALRKNGTRIIVVSGKEQYRLICEQLNIPFLLKPVEMQTLEAAICAAEPKSEASQPKLKSLNGFSAIYP